MTNPFDADTALEPLGEGLWRGHVPERWLVARGAHGGFVAALAARAAEAIDAERPLRSLTVHYLEALEPGPLEVRATRERAGGSTSGVSVRIERDGRPAALALAILGAWRDSGVEWRDAAMPEARPAHELERSRGGGIRPGFMSNFDMRWALGADLRDGPSEGLAGGWLRTAEPRPLDAVALVAYADAWMPAAFARIGAVAPAPTLDLTVHVRAPLPPPGMAPEDHVLGVFSTRWGAGGLWEEDGELWSADGVLLAHSRQLAMLWT